MNHSTMFNRFLSLIYVALAHMTQNPDEIGEKTSTIHIL